MTIDPQYSRGLQLGASVRLPGTKTYNKVWFGISVGELRGDADHARQHGRFLPAGPDGTLSRRV